MPWAILQFQNKSDKVGFYSCFLLLTNLYTGIMQQERKVSELCERRVLQGNQ